MIETKLMEIERIRLISTDFGGATRCDMLEFQFTNESYSYNSKSEDVECEITERQAIELIGHIKSHFDISGWISVDIDLPDDSTSVLAACCDDVCECLFNVYDEAPHEFVSACSGKIFEATHWMPLPEPPKAN